MSKLESHESDSVEGSESEKTFSMAEPAARFLLRALQELHLADNTITVKDLQPLAEQVRTEMGLMVGNEEGGAVRKDRLFPRRASDIPIREIVDRLSGNIGALCEYLLPNGRREGGEWRCGSVQGEPGKSLGVQG